jgi:hypothetical protein
MKIKDQINLIIGKIVPVLTQELKSGNRVEITIRINQSKLYDFHTILFKGGKVEIKNLK